MSSRATDLVQAHSLHSFPRYICVWHVVLWPVVPHAPTRLAVTNIEATHARLQFSPGFSGHTFISLWIVEAQKNYISGNESWTEIYSVVEPRAVSLTVPTLQPYTAYRLRLTAQNIAGQSPPSQPTDWFDTLQALPSSPPTEVAVRSVSATALLVRWAVC